MPFCIAQDPDMQSAEKAVKLYLDMEAHHADDGYWQAEYNSLVIHQNNNWMGADCHYSCIPSAPKNFPKGDILFTSYSIVSSSIVNEHVDYTTDKKEKAIVFMVKYRAIASIGGSGFIFYNTPLDFIEYLIFSRDPLDKNFKLIDSVPSFRSHRMYGAQYYYDHLDNYIENKKQKNSFRNAYLEYLKNSKKQN